MTEAAPAPAAAAATSRLRIGQADFCFSSAAGTETAWMDHWGDGSRFLRNNGSAFEAALGPLLDNGDEAVWMIRRIALDFSVDGGQAATARTLATALAEAITRAIRGDGAGGGVMRFPSRSAYLARLLLDLARGDAFDRWYHQQYRHLAALPVQDAIAHLLARDSPNGRMALAELAGGSGINELAQILSEAAAARILQLLAPISPQEASAVSPPPVPTELVAGIVARWGGRSVARLVLFAHLLGTTGLPAHACGAAAKAAVNMVTAAPFGAASAPLNRRSPLARSAVNIDPRRQHRKQPHRPAPAIAAELPNGLARGGAVETAHAGLFLLWRSVVELGLDQLLPPGPAGAGARLTLAATIAGPDWRLALCDPATHWLVGHDGLNPKRTRPPAGLCDGFRRLMEDRAAPESLSLVLQRHRRLLVLQDRDSEDWIQLLADDDAIPLVETAPCEARPAGRDFAFFGLGSARDKGRFPWALLARAAYADLGRRLPGLARSSAAWLAANVTSGPGRIVFDEVPEVILPRVPMDLVVRATGLDGTLVAPGEGPRYRLRLAGAYDAGR